MPHQETAIECVDVIKAFGETVALRGLSLEVQPGEVMALLGHNGAGKTVTVRILSTLSWPSSGSVTVCGYDTRRDPTAIRRVLGVCLDAPLLWPHLTGGEHVRLLADAYGVPAKEAWAVVQETLTHLEFTLPAAMPVSQFSLGMTRKLGLALSLLHRPRVVVWDEPEIGLDAVSRIAFKQLVRRVQSSGTTVLLTTHALELAEAVADRIAVMRNGVIAAVDTAERLRATTDATLEDAFLALVADREAV